jgi:hypothetical protein
MTTITRPPPKMMNVHQYWDQPVVCATKPAAPTVIGMMAKTRPPGQIRRPLTRYLAVSRMTPSAPRPMSRYAQKFSQVTTPVKPEEAGNSSVPMRTTLRPKMTALTMIQNGDQDAPPRRPVLAPPGAGAPVGPAPPVAPCAPSRPPGMPLVSPVPGAVCPLCLLRRFTLHGLAALRAELQIGGDVRPRSSCRLS